MMHCNERSTNILRNMSAKKNILYGNEGGEWPYTLSTPPDLLLMLLFFQMVILILSKQYNIGTVNTIYQVERLQKIYYPGIHFLFAAGFRMIMPNKTPNVSLNFLIYMMLPN